MTADMTTRKISNTPSIQVIQDVYNTLTGKTETLTSFLFDKHVVRFSDLQNLHAFIEQAAEQYNVATSSCAVVVRYADGKAERFSSFERFSSLGLNRSCPCVDLEIEYNFLIILPKIAEAKPYKIEVGLRSGLGIIESFKLTNATDAEQSMYFNLHSGTGRIEITYVDLAVARALQSVVEDWYRALQKQIEWPILKTLRKNGGFATAILRSLSVVAAVIFFYLQSRDRVTTVGEAYSALLAVSALMGTVYIVTLPIMTMVRERISRAVKSSSVILAAVDQNLFDMSKSDGKSLVYKALLSSLSTVGLGLVSAWLAVHLGIN